MSVIPTITKFIQKGNSILLNEVRNGRFAVAVCKNAYRRSSTVTSMQDICSSGSNYLMDAGCKVVLVNGGTSGIGLASASQLLCGGARCAVITGIDICQGKDAARLLNDRHGMGKATFISCNVNCMTQFDDAYRAVINKYNRLDIVVNAVGVCDGERWEREIVTNVIGNIRGTLLAYRYMGKEGLGTGGVIINIAGLSGIEPLPAAPTLSASQHAIVGLTRSFGHKTHTNKSGIRVACLCPGFTSTNFLQKIALKGMTERLGKELESTIAKAVKQKPDPCGQAVLHMVRHAKNGSVWLCEGSRLFVLNIPSKESIRTLVAQYM